GPAGGGGAGAPARAATPLRVRGACVERERRGARRGTRRPGKDRPAHLRSAAPRGPGLSEDSSMSNRNRARKRRTVATTAVAPPAAAARPAKQPRPKPESRRPTSTRVIPGFDRVALIAAGVAALVAFVVYALTVEPSLPTGDSGELITSAYVHGVAHPPGYPLYMLLGYPVSHLPGGSPALWMNLLSALLDALAVGV